MRLLLLEDEISLGKTLKERLETDRFTVDWVTTLSSATEHIQKFNYDLIILDVSLPDGTGFEFAKSIKPISTSPIIFMTALNTAENRLQGYELGAEEFIPKPFLYKELSIRIQHVLEQHVPKSVLELPQVSIDLDKMSVTDLSGNTSFLTKKDYSVLKYLIEMSPAVASRDEILEHCWGEDQFPTNRTVDNCIVRLRQTLKDDSGNIIRSARGIGYQWVAPENINTKNKKAE